MFKKLKQKIQEESGSSPESSFSHGPGLASPVSKDAPGGAFNTRRDSPMKDAGRRDSVDSTASCDDSVRPKEEVLGLLQKRTDQVKRLESKVSELAAMIKDRNKHIEKLETTLEKSEDDSVQRLQELREKLMTSQATAIKDKEEELRSYYSRLVKTNEGLEKELTTAREYKNRFLKQAEEGDELQGLNTQEIAKIKHMLLNVQEDLSQRNKDLEERSRDLESSQKQVKQLENEVMQFTQKLLEQKSESEMTAASLNEERKKNEEMAQDKTSLKTQLDTLNQQHNQTASRLSSLQASYQQIQDDHMVLQRSSDLHRQKMNSLLEEKDEQISQLQERVETLQQRVQDNTLDGDDRFQAMETERALMEKRLEEARQQLTEVKSTWSDKITLLEKQISNLNEKILEDAEDLKLTEKELADTKSSLQAQINSAKEPLENKISKLESDLSTVRSHLSKAELSLGRKEKLLLEQKEIMENEIVKCKQKSADAELELRDSVRDLEAKVVSLEKAREKDRLAAQQRITTLESSHDEWLEKEIDTEKQVTDLEEHLQKYKSESSHRERDNARLQQQLQDRAKDIKEQKEKVKSLTRALEASQTTVDQMKKDFQVIGTDFQSANKEKDELMLRNAQLFQSLEAEKRTVIEERENHSQEAKSKDIAIAGLEQSLQDMNNELSAKQQKISELESQVENAQKEFESAQLDRLKQEIADLEEQLTDKNKTIKIQQQRLIDLKKTLQRELKVQSLPNDDPMVDYNNKDAPQLEVFSSTSSSVSNKQVNAMYQGNGNMRRGMKVPAGAERTMSKMTKCSAGNDCLCEHVNFEYLKHVLIKFMTSREHEAIHLIRAVAVLLHLSLDEQRVIKDTLEWKMSWGLTSRPKLGKGQMAKVIPPSY